MPRGKAPSEKMTARLKKAQAKLGRIPQGYTIEPSPKNKFKTVGMPKDMKAEAKKATKEAKTIIKGRMSEYSEIKKGKEKTGKGLSSKSTPVSKGRK